MWFWQAGRQTCHLYLFSASIDDCSISVIAGFPKRKEGGYAVLLDSIVLYEASLQIFWIWLLYRFANIQVSCRTSGGLVLTSWSKEYDCWFICAGYFVSRLWERGLFWALYLVLSNANCWTMASVSSMPPKAEFFATKSELRPLLRLGAGDRGGEQSSVDWMIRVSR